MKAFGHRMVSGLAQSPSALFGLQYDTDIVDGIQVDALHFTKSLPRKQLVQNFVGSVGQTLLEVKHRNHLGTVGKLVD